MKLEIHQKSERKEQLILYIDDEPWKEIHCAIFGRQPRFPTKIASIPEWQEIFDGLEYRAAKNYVLKRLSLQSYYSHQLAKLLKERLIQSHTINRLLQECVGWGYLNDEAWLQSFMRGHLKRHSLRATTIKLQSKGVPPDIIQELMQQWRDPQEEKSKIQHLLQTRYRSKDLKDYKIKQKVFASLARKGYSFDLIQAALEEE